MIKDHFLPVRLRMTALAPSAQSPLVHIVLTVTPDALGRKFPRVQGRLMACIAFDRRMRFSQREVGVAFVVEAHPFPFRLRVTALAFFPVRALVHVIVPMTDDTRT